MSQYFYLESCSHNGESPARIELGQLPLTLGRSPDCSICIPLSELSRVHARIDLSNGKLVVTDLGSTNGSFVNHRRINAPTEIQIGDVLHFAGLEYCLKYDQPVAPVDEDRTRIASRTLPKHFPVKGRQFIELLERQLVTGFHQIITLADGSLYGHELLGRGTHPELGPSPYELFSIAERLGRQVEFSELLRHRSFAQAAEAGIGTPLFFNSHPKECQDPERLLSQLSDLRNRYPQLQLVFEVHESAVTDLRLMAKIRDALKQLDIGLAYDDFGAGQARLRELTEAPPDVLKFDISLVSGATDPDSPRYKLLSSLNNMVKDMGIATLAEGVETREEAEACRAIGMDYLQGYHFGRPTEIGADQALLPP